MAAWITPDWPAPPRVRALVTLRHGAGVSPPPFATFNLGLRSGDAPANAVRNRALLVELAGLPAPPQWLRQVHGIGVHRLEAPAHVDPAGESEPEADAAVTSVPGAVLAVLSADCLPVLLAARDGSEVAAAHCSWRNLAAGMLEATVAAMRTSPAQLIAWLGPAAGPAAYEVGTDVYAAFVDGDAGAAAAFVPTRPGHWLVDLYALARRRLAALGIHDVSGGGLCTISAPQQFHSFRRDGRSGRLASLVWIAPDAG
jgi:YfiH family protein